ncbi:hypothetical protein LUZ61_016353 [Rhynchospora tenuis]|uniref:BTB domain-containing protein n=1 Tax=Rhynchospora tenuis TaxID=198213 RepID=A0AAD5Z5D3_9POAL|nr:hypothetical protein LUZ61_016353 [Rhynchospora tenuis]
MRTSTSELAIGSHIFKITGYSLLKEIDVGQYVSSSAFTVGGHEFYIRIYPRGEVTGREQFISVFLVLTSDADEELPVQFEFGLVGLSAGDLAIAGQKMPGSCTFGYFQETWGFRRFISRAHLEASQYLKDDSFMVKCTIRVAKETSEEARQSIVQPSDLHLHLTKLLESSEMADVTFEVDEESFIAHRIVVAARSSVFKQLLCQGDNDASSCVRIQDVKAPVFKALLRYLYTDKLPNCTDKNLPSFDQQLLLAADKYAIKRLKFICEEKICNKLSVDTVAFSFQLAEKCKCDRLNTACLEFAAKPENLIALMQMYAKISQGLEQQNTAGLSGGTAARHRCRTNTDDTEPPPYLTTVIALPPKPLLSVPPFTATVDQICFTTKTFRTPDQTRGANSAAPPSRTLLRPAPTLSEPGLPLSFSLGLNRDTAVVLCVLQVFGAFGANLGSKTKKTASVRIQTDPPGFGRTRQKRDREQIWKLDSCPGSQNNFGNLLAGAQDASLA